MGQLLNEKLAEFPAISDSFQWYSQYHKYNYVEMEGGGHGGP